MRAAIVAAKYYCTFLRPAPVLDFMLSGVVPLCGGFWRLRYKIATGMIAVCQLTTTNQCDKSKTYI